MEILDFRALSLDVTRRFTELTYLRVTHKDMIQTIKYLGARATTPVDQHLQKGHLG